MDLEKFEKLPKWAKQLIKEKDTEIRSLKERLAVADQNPLGSGIVSYHILEEAISLPDRSIVNFGKNNLKIRVNLCKVSGCELPMGIYVNGDRAVKIIPQAANAFYVGMDR